MCLLRVKKVGLTATMGNKTVIGKKTQKKSDTRREENEPATIEVLHTSCHRLACSLVVSGQEVTA